MAIVQINSLAVRTVIGVHPWERANKQEIIIDISFEYDAAKASKSDNLKDALDYEALTNQVIRLVERSKYRLLEKLAAKVLDVVMVNKEIKQAWVRLDKPQALPQAKSVSFELFAQQ